MIGVLDIRSSWTVEGGFARPLGELEVPTRQRGYRCSGCEKRGHSIRTCGMTDEERAERRRDRGP